MECVDAPRSSMAKFDDASEGPKPVFHILFRLPATMTSRFSTAANWS